jgi:hypothetical protein
MVKLFGGGGRRCRRGRRSQVPRPLSDASIRRRRARNCWMRASPAYRMLGSDSALVPHQGRPSPPEQQQPDRKDRRHSLIQGTAPQPGQGGVA